MTKTQAYFGPHAQVYTNETNFNENRVGFLIRIDSGHQQTIKLQEKCDVQKSETPFTPKSPKIHKSPYQIEQEFLIIQARALSQLRSALKKALERFNKKPPKFQNNDDHMILVHVRSYFERAIKNLHGNFYEYSSPKATHVFGGVPTVNTGLLTNLDGSKYNSPYNEYGFASSSRSNNLLITSSDVASSSRSNKPLTVSNDVATSSRSNNGLCGMSRKGNLDSPQTNNVLIGNALEFPIVIECDDDDRDFKSGDRESPIVLDSDDEKDLHLKRKSLPNDHDNGAGPSNKKLKSMKVEDDTLGEFIPIEPITLSDLNAPQRVFLHSDDKPNGIHEKSNGIHEKSTTIYEKYTAIYENPKYCSKEISKSVSVMATNKILAAYTVTLGLQELNGMEFPVIIKLHADAFEAYFGAYYLACGELATCVYLENLMTPLFDLIVAHIAAGVSLEELVKRTARANRFRDTLDPSQLLSVGGVVPHGRNSIVKNDGSPINPVDDFFEVLSIYHQTQMMIKQVNNTLPLVRKKLAWDFFHEETLPITLNSLYEKDDPDKSKNFVEIENVDFIMEASKFPTKPKSLDLSTSPNFFDVEMEDVERFIATSPVSTGATFRYVEMDTPLLSNPSTIIQTDQLTSTLNLSSQLQMRLGTRSNDVIRKNSLERINSIIPATEKSNSMLSTMDVEYETNSNQDESIIGPENTLVNSPTEEEFKQIGEATTETTDVISNTDPPIVDEVDDEPEELDLPTPKLDLYSLVHGPPQLTQAQVLKEDKIKQRQALYKKTKALPDRRKSEKKRRKKRYDILINKNRNVQCVLSHIDDQKAEAIKKAQEEVELQKKAIEEQSSYDEDYESARQEIRRRSQIFEGVKNKYIELAKKDPKYNKYSMTKIQEEARIEIDNTPSLLRS
ncbi:5332_t:CDS:2 [Racocetra fulgida]|uniref:5332_t:CDS:1 n=1 Tax=Racocetra fulgida TaxID=60492 RepID=A0A9N8W763_9GLOM|nr:5332_t:CDS:2 [Racocetra fulgida]